jgi:hypothetical protein
MKRHIADDNAECPQQDGRVGNREHLRGGDSMNEQESQQFRELVRRFTEACRELHIAALAHREITQRDQTPDWTQKQVVAAKTTPLVEATLRKDYQQLLSAFSIDA